MKRRMVLVLLLVFPTFVFADPPSWPQWRGPNGNWTSTETGWNPLALKAGAKVLWNVDLGIGYSSVAIQDNRLYTMGKSGTKYKFFCLDPGTGEVIWSTNCPFPPGTEPMSTPCIDGDRVYGVGKDGTVLCLGAADGKILWTKNLKTDFHAARPQQGYAASPVVDGDLLFLNANTKQLALDKKTGDLKWSFDDEVPMESTGSFTSPVMMDFNGMRCVLFVGPSTLSIVEPKTGNKVWSYAHGETSEPSADPIVHDDKFFVETGKAGCFQFDMASKTPSLVWKNHELGLCVSGPVLVNGYLYGSTIHTPLPTLTWEPLAHPDWPVKCVDWSTGEVKWQKNMEFVTLSAADGKLLMLEVRGRLHIVEATQSGYKELSSADVLGGADKPRTFATPPVLCGGKIYCRNYAGDLICIDVSK